MTGQALAVQSIPQPAEPADDHGRARRADPNAEPRRQRTGAEVIVETLEELGVTHVFGIPGGNVIPFYDALYRASKLRGVLVRHEEGGVHAAHGYATASGHVGVCVATSGPGATNLVTGLADALADSAPLIAITGAVFSTLIGTDAFQDADILGITESVTKHSFRVTSVDEIEATIRAAHAIATTGRPGPVLVDITKDAQQAMENAVEADVLRSAHGDAVAVCSTAQLRRVAEVLRGAQHPVLAAGTGVVRADAACELRTLADLVGAAVVTSDAASGILDGSDSRWAGPGSSEQGMTTLARCDVLVCVGVGAVATRALMRRVPSRAHIVEVDVDSAELTLHPPAISLLGDAGSILRALRALCATDACALDARSSRAPAPAIGAHGVVPVLLRSLAREARTATTLVGEYPCAAALASARHDESLGGGFLTSGGLVREGFAIPAALGAAAALPSHQVWAVTDVPGFQRSSRELATAVTEGLALKVVVLSAGVPGIPSVSGLGEALGAVSVVVCDADEIWGAVRLAAMTTRSVVIELRDPAQIEA